eukprot:3733010-Pyramimonas_sp.AAC.1
MLQHHYNTGMPLHCVLHRATIPEPYQTTLTDYCIDILRTAGSRPPTHDYYSQCYTTLLVMQSLNRDAISIPLRMYSCNTSIELPVQYYYSTTEVLQYVGAPSNAAVLEYD